VLQCDQVVDFPFTYIEVVRRCRQLLDDFTNNDSPGGVRELPKLLKRVPGGLLPAAPFMRYGQ